MLVVTTCGVLVSRCTVANACIFFCYPKTAEFSISDVFGVWNIELLRRARHSPLHE